MDRGLEVLNALSSDEFQQAIWKCCGSKAFVAKLNDHRPFKTWEKLANIADDLWDNNMAREDWLEAFLAHPRIGDKEFLRSKFQKGAQESEEQSGAANASEEILDRLAEGNRRYEEKFGHIFLICASGKSAEEMLNALEIRIQNEPSDEVSPMQSHSAIIQLYVLSRSSSLPKNKGR